MPGRERTFSTIQDLADNLGVSGATVSRALNDRPGVSEPLRAKIKAEAARMGLHLHGPAAAMARNRTNVLGLIVSTVANWLFAELAGAVERAASDRGLSVILANSDEDPDKELRYLKTMYQHRVAGIILNPSLYSRRHRDIIQATPLPIVYLDRTVPGDNTTPLVTVDPLPPIRELVTAIVSTGRRRLAVIAGPRGAPTAAARLGAFKRAAREHQITVEPTMIVHGDFYPESGAAAMRRLLALRPRPEAVFVANNLMTRGAMQALQHEGVPVPDELSLASFDDVPWFDVMNPSITAIAQPTKDLGVTAVDILQAAINGENPRSVRLPGQLILRESTTPRAR